MPWTFAAGQILTADDLNAHNPVFADKTADESRTSTTVCTADAELFVDLVAGRTYDIEMKASFHSSGSSTPDIKVKWVNTGTMNEIVSRLCIGPSINTTDVEGSSAAAITVGVVRASTATLATEISYGCDGSGVRGALMERFSLSVSVSGRLTMQWAQRTSSATSVVITGSSRIIAIPVA